MGKSGGRKKKANGSNAVASANHVSATNPGLSSSDGVDSDTSVVFLKRTHELKEEGNRCFQSKDYVAALQQYESALKLLPKSHPDRAVFHSNRAACLMQMKPVQFDAVISECTLALHAQPQFPRALMRRARAYEALGRLDMAFVDVQSLLRLDPGNQDGLELARKLRVALVSHRNGAQQDQQSGGGVPQLVVPAPISAANSPSPSPTYAASPAALGASAVPGAPIACLGPCLPARPKRPAKSVEKSSAEDHVSAMSSLSNGFHSNSNMSSSVSNANSNSSSAVSRPQQSKTELGSIALKTFPKSSNKAESVGKDRHKVNDVVGDPERAKQFQDIVWRPLKLVYDHDIRLAKMPANCSFRVLREIVGKRFPSSKSVLVKYHDMDGDLVTITGTSELRMAESCIDGLKVKKANLENDNQKKSEDCVKVGNAALSSGSSSNSGLELLRLHIVEVDSEQEPPLMDEEVPDNLVELPVQDDIVNDGGKKGEDSKSQSSTTEGATVGLKGGQPHSEDEIHDKKCDHNHDDCKEVEIDDWLFEFAQLFRSHVGIDPDAHVDLHELGMELCSEALEETVTSEEAQLLFEMASAKFQEVAALAFFNWGNVHMCAARKRIPLDEASPKEVIEKQLQSAYDWVQERYALAGEKYEEALRIKPDFYEGLLALGQQNFEMAKLHWSYALASKLDLSSWNSSETVKLFDTAEEKMKSATEMWEKLEEQRNNELKDPVLLKKEEIIKRKKKAMLNTETADVGDSGGDDAAEQAAVMRSQIHLFWGNMLFERSQVEFKLGMSGWKQNLDNSVERFKLAGASEADISTVLKNHASNSNSSEGTEKNENDVNNPASLSNELSASEN